MIVKYGVKKLINRVLVIASDFCGIRAEVLGISIK